MFIVFMGNSLPEAVKLAKNTTHFDKYKYSEYGIGFYTRNFFDIQW